MRERYGAFILFRPEFSSRNAWLWLLPGVLLLGGGLIGWRVLRQRRALEPLERTAGGFGLSSGFVALAVLMSFVAVALVVWPLWRQGSSPRATAAALALVCAIPLAAVLLYKVWSNHDWSEPAVADNPAAMVARLARRLEREPDDKPGWLQLGRSVPGVRSVSDGRAGL